MCNDDNDGRDDTDPLVLRWTVLWWDSRAESDGMTVSSPGRWSLSLSNTLPDPYYAQVESMKHIIFPTIIICKILVVCCDCLRVGDWPVHCPGMSIVRWANPLIFIHLHVVLWDFGEITVDCSQILEWTGPGWRRIRVFINYCIISFTSLRISPLPMPCPNSYFLGQQSHRAVLIQLLVTFSVSCYKSVDPILRQGPTVDRCAQVSYSETDTVLRPTKTLTIWSSWGKQQRGINNLIKIGEASYSSKDALLEEFKWNVTWCALLIRIR